MDIEDLQGIIHAEVSDARDFVDEVGRHRALATRYYRGEPFGDEVEGRSKVVSHDVRDTVQMILPSVVEVFFGTGRPVEFVPTGPEDVELAEQATDYVTWIVREDNNGFAEFYAAAKDALVRKTGVIKFWWEERRDVTSDRYEGLDEVAYQALLADPDIEVVEAEIRQEEWGIRYDVQVRRVVSDGRVALAAVPPEEFLIARDAGLDVSKARFVAHRRYMTVSDLVAMGYDQQTVLQYAGDSTSLDWNDEDLARNPFRHDYRADRTDDAARRVLVHECFVRADKDGDGVAELLRVVALGEGLEVVTCEPAPLVPFAVLHCDPEPHSFFGLSIADLTMDIQRIKSQVLRNMLDSLAQSINPRQWAVEGQVNMDDLLNNEVGSVIRVRAPGMVGDLSTPFVGQSAFPVLEYMDAVREARTGVTKASAGLDPDALQSTTKAAVTATIQSAQQRIKLICRVFAELGIKPLYRGIYQLVRRHQSIPRMVRLRGAFVRVDPRDWGGNYDVAVNVGIGLGNAEERIASLTTILNMQQQAMQQLGQQNPLTDIGRILNTLHKLAEATGYPAEHFWLDRRSSQQAQQLLQQSMAQQPPKPDPTEMLAQIEAQKLQLQREKAMADFELKRARLAQDAREAMMEDDRERDELDANIILRAVKEFGVDPDAVLAYIRQARNGGGMS